MYDIIIQSIKKGFYLSELEKIIYMYIVNSKIKYLSSSFLNLLKSGKLKGTSFKVLKKFVKDEKFKDLELQLIKYFKMYDISYSNKKIYDSKMRQQVFRERNKISDKKQINFYVDNNLYDSIFSLKSELKLSYSELMEYFIKKEKED